MAHGARLGASSLVKGFTVDKDLCGTFLGSFDRSAVSLSNLKIILI